MKFDVGVPSGAIKHYEQWVGDGHLKDFAVHAEQAGIDGVNVTDHPFPEDSWLANGGHHAFDPFVALSSMAAVTDRIRLRGVTRARGLVDDLDRRARDGRAVCGGHDAGQRRRRAVHPRGAAAQRPGEPADRGPGRRGGPDSPPA